MRRPAASGAVRGVLAAPSCMHACQVPITLFIATAIFSDPVASQPESSRNPQPLPALPPLRRRRWQGSRSPGPERSAH